jgi:hypothetical protein
MDLNEFQKDMVKAIAEGEISDLATFIQKKLTDTEITTVGDEMSYYLPVILHHPDESINKLQSFIGLILLMESVFCFRLFFQPSPEPSP